MWYWLLHVVVAVACNGCSGCICGTGCCTWWWQLHVMVAVVVYVVVVVACGGSEL